MLKLLQEISCSAPVVKVSDEIKRFLCHGFALERTAYKNGLKGPLLRGCMFLKQIFTAEKSFTEISGSF